MLLTVPSTALGQNPSYLSAETIKEGDITERVIKIEGSLERPRTLFIVPRARLWKGDLLDKSFRERLLDPLFPESIETKRTRK
jgi:hypothetical protein